MLGQGFIKNSNAKGRRLGAFELGREEFLKDRKLTKYVFWLLKAISIRYIILKYYAA